MTVILAFVGLAAPVAVLVSLIRTIAADGYGTRPTPRSHPEETGSWIDRQLAR